MSIEEKMIQEFHERDLTNGKIFKLLNKVCDTEDKLLSTLNEEQNDFLKKFYDAVDKLHLEAIEEALIYGFRYGVSLLNELSLIKSN